MYMRTLVITVFVATWQCTTLASAQSIEGTYRGTLVCEKMPASPDILEAPLDVSVRGNSVLFARPLFNWNGTRVVGSELGTGTIDAEGKMHLTSSWYNGGMTVQGDYSGALTKTGGMFSGTQAWRGGQGNSGN